MTTYHRYRIGFDHTSGHVVDIALTVPVPAGENAVEVSMPAWCPGSYLIRDYARFVRDLWATDEKGSPRPARKISKDTWSIDAAGAQSLTVHYSLYGHELTVRTNHIDDTHVFLHGPATWLTTVAGRELPVEIEFALPTGWRLATGADGDKTSKITAASVDELFDLPLHFGAPTTTHHQFTAAGVPFEFALWGEFVPGGQFTTAQLLKDLATIVEDHAKRMGEVPFKNYTFVLFAVHDGYGGLEHRNSSINVFNDRALHSRKQYEGMLELLSHEFFHAWNGKRIAPNALLHFDYTREAYTRCLWVMEGMTSHYDRFALRSSGVVTAKNFLENVLDEWTRLMAIPGRSRQSLEDSSFDAWIKLYKPDESNLNTTVSYYLKGGLVMFALDLAIRRQTDGNRTLDDVLRMLWRDFGARGIPHPEDLESIFAEATGISMSDVFATQIRGVQDPQLAVEFAHVGLELRSGWEPAQIEGGQTPAWLGVTMSGAKVTAVFDDSPAMRAGLSPGDELIAVDGCRASAESDSRALLSARSPDDAVELLVFRRHRVVSLRAILAPAPPTRWEIIGVTTPGEAAARYTAWLGEAHPSGQTVATVTTTNRSL